MTLLDAAIGSRVVLRSMPHEHARQLARHGLVPGRALIIEQDTPFGGPRLLRVGVRRLSVPRALAASIAIEAG